MHTVISTITPTKAAALLETNTGNRTVSMSIVLAYARDMVDGHWACNGEAIKISKSGRLIDGQHRLLACIRANASFDTLVITEIRDDAQHTIDGGKKRSVADRFQMAGVRNSTRTAATINQVYHIANRVDLMRSEAKLTQLLCMAVLKHWPSISNAVGATMNIFPNLSTQLAAVCFIGRVMDHDEDVDSFVATFKTGIPAYDGDPVHALRERLIRSAASATPLNNRQKLRLLCRAWEMRIAKDRVSGSFPIPGVPRIYGWAAERFNFLNSKGIGSN